MKNFERLDFVVKDTSIASFMIDADDDKQLVRFCRDKRCDNCLFAPDNYRRKFGKAQQGCYRNKMDYLYREGEE